MSEHAKVPEVAAIAEAHERSPECVDRRTVELAAVLMANLPFDLAVIQQRYFEAHGRFLLVSQIRELQSKFLDLHNRRSVAEIAEEMFPELIPERANL